MSNSELVASGQVCRSCKVSIKIGDAVIYNILWPGMTHSACALIEINNYRLNLVKQWGFCQ